MILKQVLRMLNLLPFISYTSGRIGQSNDILRSAVRNISYDRPGCEVPRFAPYFWVKDVSKDTILMGVTDPNKDLAVKGYNAYFWGHRFGAESTLERVNRDYGQRFIPKKGPYKITDLKPGFIYCADITAVNDCGHGPFCVACFENIATLQK